MKKIYISLPISGRPLEEVQEEIKTISDHLLDIATEQGEHIQIVSPLLLARLTQAHFETDEWQALSDRQQYAMYLATDVAEILGSIDAIYFARTNVALPSYTSKGMRLEYQISKIYNIPAFGKGWCHANFNLSRAFLK